MTKVVLIRHGRSTANANGVLAGRMPGVVLDEQGRVQAQALRDVLNNMNITAAYTSPIQRCIDTATLAGFPEAQIIEGLSECDYGAWTGSRLANLATEALWREVQDAPSTVRFPGGEGMLEMALRVVDAVANIISGHRSGDTVVLFSHADPIKAILADALAIEFNEFQRLHVNPAGMSIIDYSGVKPVVLCLNASKEVSRLLSDSGPTVGGGDSPPAS